MPLYTSQHIAFHSVAFVNFSCDRNEGFYSRFTSSSALHALARLSAASATALLFLLGLSATIGRSESWHRCCVSRWTAFSSASMAGVDDVEDAVIGRGDAEGGLGVFGSRWVVGVEAEGLAV